MGIKTLFLLSLFVAMYLNNVHRETVNASIGLHARKFDSHVICKTNQSSSRLFTTTSDVDNPILQ